MAERNKMRNRTKWKKEKNKIVGKQCFNQEIGIFTIRKIQKCKEYCSSAFNLDGSRWFEVQRVFIKTENGRKYIIPYNWMVMNCEETSSKKMLWKVIDRID